MSSPQRGRKRGPYKPRQPKVEQGVQVTPGIEIPVATEMITPAVPAATYPDAVGEVFTHLLVRDPAAIRFVRFRYAWNDGDTCPALMWDGQLAVLMPPYASPAAGCSFTFRASTGGFSFAPAIPGAGVGQYTEV